MQIDSWNKQLRQERIRRNWRQQDLADQLGATVLTIQRWERGSHQPSVYFRVKLRTLLGIVIDESSTALVSPVEPIWKVPTSFNSLLGREHDLEWVLEALLHSDVRLLTLCGPGGVGKTRLVLQVANEARGHFTDGVCFISLEDVSDLVLLPQVIAEAFHIPDNGMQSTMERVIYWLANKHILLILDNFEHLIVSAPQIEYLLRGCPKLTIITTSREILHIINEHTFPVGPLALPDLQQSHSLEAIAGYPSVALFVERAQASLPTFRLTPMNVPVVTQICMRLDGLPLAIELAATRIRFLSPQALLARLSLHFGLLTGGSRTLHPRQQTLYNTLDWSYNLLNEEEKQLLRQLAVFAGGFPLAAVESVCSQLREPGSSVLPILVSLFDKSLLQQIEGDEIIDVEPRWRLLTTIRDFALERLQQAGESEIVRHAHAVYYLLLAERLEPYLAKTEQTAYLTQLDQEHENIQAALNWLLEHSFDERTVQSEHVLRLCGALYPFWWIRGYLQEGALFLGRALEMRENASLHVQAKALCAYARLLFILEGIERAEAWCQESLTLYRQLGETNGIVTCLFLQGRFARNRCQHAIASEYLQEAITLAQDQNDMQQQSLCRSEYALVFLVQGEYHQTRTQLEESLQLASKIGDRALMAWSHYLLALAFFLTKKSNALAMRHLDESIKLYQSMNDRWHVAYGLNLQGEIYLSQGKMLKALALCEESLVVFREIGTHVDIAEFQLTLARACLLQGKFEISRALYQESLATLEAIEDREPIPTCLEGLGTISARQGRLIEAVHLWGKADELRHILGTPMPPVYYETYAQDFAAIHDQLGEQPFAQALSEGRVMARGYSINVHIPYTNF